MRSVYFIMLLVLICACDRNEAVHRSFSTPLAKEIKEQKKVWIVAIHHPRKDLVDSVAQSIQRYYGFETKVVEGEKLPERFRSPRGKDRYRADSIIRYLQDRYPQALKVVGITGSEISTTKYKHGKIKEPEWKYKDWGIFGLGFRPGKSCVVSYRYLLNRGSQQLNERVRKITLHEVGHTLGLPHCPNKKCVMTDACETLNTIDQAQAALCASCKKKILL